MVDSRKFNKDLTSPHRELRLSDIYRAQLSSFYLISIEPHRLVVSYLWKRINRSLRFKEISSPLPCTELLSGQVRMHNSLIFASILGMNFLKGELPTFCDNICSEIKQCRYGKQICRWSRIHFVFSMTRRNGTRFTRLPFRFDKFVYWTRTLINDVINFHIHITNKHFEY